MQSLEQKEVALPFVAAGRTGGGWRGRHSGRLFEWLPACLRQSGMAIAALATACAAASAQAPVSFEVVLGSGTVLAVDSIRSTADGGLECTPKGGARRVVPAGELLAIHGAPVVPPALPAAHLVGDELVRGALVGGDRNGDRLDVLSPVLGTVPIQVDRLALWAGPDVPPLLPLELPEGVDEALFVRAKVGFDVIAGTLHQFGAAGVRFQPEGGEPRWFGANDFVALRLRPEPAPSTAPVAWLTTRTGDRVRVDRWRCDGEAFVVVVHGGTELRLRSVDLASLTCLGGGAVFASDLEPSEVQQTGVDGDVVYGWQRDRNVLGAPLQVAGRSHGKGLGVHSRSRLSFRVPTGAARFWTRVGLDDSVQALPLLPDVAVRIELDGKVVFRRDGLGAGQIVDPGPLPVVAGSTVVLEVDFGRGRDLGDRVDWLSPVFLPAVVRRP